MKKVNWDLEEAVVLYDLYFRSGRTLKVAKNEIDILTCMYKKRAKDLGIVIDEKFRNYSGLRMQIGCIHYVVTCGKEGMSNASKLFYDTYELCKYEPEKFQQILKEFYEKYSI